MNSQHYFMREQAQKAYPEPICVRCGLNPRHLPEYMDAAQREGGGVTPELYVIYNEGTYNPTNGHFTCDNCYILLGCPSSPTGWVAP